MRWLGRLVLVGPVLLAAALLVGGCNEDKVEQVLGGDVARSVEDSYAVVANPAVNDWLSYVGRTTVSFTTRQHIPYSFKVLDSDTANAFAAPWGHVYFYTGLMDMAEDEDEVWGVMGHEVGHVVHRDVIKAVKRSVLWSIGLSVVSDRSRSLGDVLGIGLGLLSFSYSRDDERRADDHGAQVVVAEGHDPNYTVVFFNRLMAKYEKDKPSKLEQLLATHPLTADRIARLKKRPEFDPGNAVALAKIGDGYLRRGRSLAAMRFLQQALGKDPSLVPARLSLSEAALERGYLDVARDELQKAQDKLGYVPAVRRRAAEVAELKPQTWPEPAAADREAATAALAEASAAEQAVAARAQASQADRAALASRVQPLSAQAGQLMKQISALGQTDAQLSTQMQNSLVRGNTAIAGMSELVSMLEGIGDQAALSEGRLKEAQAALARVKGLSAVALPPGAAGWLRRSYAELQRAPEDITAAMAAAAEALPAAQKAVASSADAATYMAKLMQVGDNDLLFDSLRAAAAEVQQNTTAAAAATKKSKASASRAEARIYVADLNLAGAGATPEELAAMTDLVAYFSRSTPGRVRELMGQGLGLGEAGACLMSCRAVSRSAGDLGRAALGGNGMVDAVETAGGSFRGASILLKYAANAIKQELPTGSHEAPRFTS